MDEYKKLNIIGVCNLLKLSSATLSRWQLDDAMTFPKAHLATKRDVYWYERDIIEWQE